MIKSTNPLHFCEFREFPIGVSLEVPGKSEIMVFIEEFEIYLPICILLTDYD